MREMIPELESQLRDGPLSAFFKPQPAIASDENGALDSLALATPAEDGRADTELKGEHAASVNADAEIVDAEVEGLPPPS